MNQDPNTELLAQYEEKIKTAGIADGSPEYKQLIDAFLAAADKAKFVAEYGNDKTQPTPDEKNFHFDELEEVPANLKWKEEYDRFFRVRADEEKRPFVRTDKRTDTALEYNLDRSYVRFPGQHRGQIESDKYADFKIMCKTALDTGHTHAELGKFKEHPEYRAKFVLACLETGLEITNMPELESLKTFPEYAQIREKLNLPPEPAPAPEQTPPAPAPAPEKQPDSDERTAIRASVIQAHKELQESQAIANADTAPGGYVEKKKSYDGANKAWKADKDNQDLKKARNGARDEMNTTASGAALKAAENNYETAMKKAVQYYIEKGEIESVKGVKTTAEERKQKLVDHLQKYDAYKYYDGDKKQEQKQNRQPAQNIIKNIVKPGGRGK